MIDTQNQLVVSRSLKGSPEEVFDAWTNPELLARWWWPAKWQTKIEVDLHVGGRYSFRTIEIPEMGVLNVGGEYREVVRPERLVYTWRWEGGPDTLVTVEFIPKGTETELRLTHVGFENEGERDQHRHGWNDCIDRLDRMLVTGEQANT